MVQLCGESNLKLDESRCFFAKQSKLAHGLNLKMSKNDLSALQAKNVSCFQNFRKYIFLTKLNTILVVIHTDMPLLHLKQIKKKNFNFNFCVKQAEIKSPSKQHLKLQFFIAPSLLYMIPSERGKIVSITPRYATFFFVFAHYLLHS